MQGPGEQWGLKLDQKLDECEGSGERGGKSGNGAQSLAFQSFFHELLGVAIARLLSISAELKTQQRNPDFASPSVGRHIFIPSKQPCKASCKDKIGGRLSVDVFAFL